jgi:hypothetical protein
LTALPVEIVGGFAGYLPMSWDPKYHYNPKAEIFKVREMQME